MTSQTQATGPARPGLRVLIAAGGTGGHVYPAIAIARHLRQAHPEAEILFVGTRERMEAQAVPDAGFRLAAIKVKGLAGRQSHFQRLVSLAWLLAGLPVWQSLVILLRFRPHVVVGMGGFASGPVILAARMLRIPCLAVEQNEIPGFTTRLVARMVSAAAVVSEQCQQRYLRLLGRRARTVPVRVVGNPVRPEILSTTRDEGIKALGLDPGRVVLLAVGGSIGSLPVNRAFAAALELLAKKPGFADRVEILHITGRQNVAFLDPARARELGLRYHVRDYLDDMHHALAAADVVVTRAGGTALAEMTARGLPAVVIPWAGAADGHQEHNALRLANAGAAVMIRDAELTPERLADAVWALVSDEAARRRLAERSRSLGRPDAAARVVGMIEQLAGR